MSKLKPEAAYFFPDHGLRSAMMFFDMKDASEIPAVVESLFAGLNARIQLVPVMNADDLGQRKASDVIWPTVASHRPGPPKSRRTASSCVTPTVSKSHTFIMRVSRAGDQPPSCLAKMRRDGLRRPHQGPC